MPVFASISRGTLRSSSSTPTPPRMRARSIGGRAFDLVHAVMALAASRQRARAILAMPDQRSVRCRTDGEREIV
jgi:hypothetical protein